MAKSIRSKRRRKMRAIKRLQTGPKELKRLKKTLGLIIDDDPNLKRYKFGDVREKLKKQKLNQASGVPYHPKHIRGAEAEWESIWRESKQKKNEKERQKKGIAEEDEESEEDEATKVTKTMDVDREDLQVDPVTLKNQHGSYPVWMNQRQIKKLKSARSGGKVLKKGQKKYLW
ncbi:protein LLP homolog [Apostichopus japonicus]|uniref:protein LLP homolog n=1 Tax=Stichopus japonicus TaxID=307972 RepID=UPI003AB81251